MAEQCETEQRRIIEIGARFALLVEKNAILGFNASLGTYLKAQIESLQNKIPSDPSEPHEHILQSLENFRRSLNSYNEERRIFQEAVSNGDAAVPTAGEVEAMIHELEGLPLVGRGFQQALWGIRHRATCAGGPRTCSRPGSRGGLVQGRGLLSDCGASERARPAFWRCLL